MNVNCDCGSGDLANKNYYMLTIIIRTVVALPVYSHPQTKARVGLVWDLGYCWLGTLNLEYCRLAT